MIEAESEAAEVDEGSVEVVEAAEGEEGVEEVEEAARETEAIGIEFSMLAVCESVVEDKGGIGSADSSAMAGRWWWWWWWDWMF